MDPLSLLFVISHGANAIIAIILIFAMLRLYQKTSIRLILLMVVLMVSWSITNTLLILPNIIQGTTETDTLVILIATWNIIGSAIVPSVFIIFIDAFEGKIEVKKVSVAAATFAAAFFIALMGLSSGNIDLSSSIVVVEDIDLITMRWSPISSLAIFPTVIACGIWTQRELNKSAEYAIDERQLRQINYMKLGGILMFYIGPAFGIAGVIAVDGLGLDVLGTILSEIVGYLFVSIGIIMITLAYTTSDAVAFLQPQRMDSLIVMLSTGVPVFQYEFSPREDRTDVGLISGAITAIQAIMAEAFNVKSEVKEITFYDKELLLDFEKLTEYADLAYVLISDRSSTYLETALARFAASFREFVPHTTIDGVMMSADENVQAETMLRTAFGLSSIK